MSTSSCPSAWCLFWAGALLAFFFAFEYVLHFLFSFNRALDIQAEPRISEWIGFVLFLPLGFGIAFQLPLVMFFLNRIGLISVKAYLEKWRIAILIIFVLSMILTPADPISMLLMALPLCGLYFLGIAHGPVDAAGTQPVHGSLRTVTTSDVHDGPRVRWLPTRVHPCECAGSLPAAGRRSCRLQSRPSRPSAHP